jgi:DNA mismatch repair ATPase MutS
VTRRLGTRLLSRWIRRPLVKREEIEARLDKVEYLVRNTVLREKIRAVLKSTPDLGGCKKGEREGVRLTVFSSRRSPLR